MIRLERHDGSHPRAAGRRPHARPSGAALHPPHPRGQRRRRRGRRRREREILQLIAEGRTNSEIAATLSLSLSTVETHRKQIMKKLDLHKTAELVRFALRKQVVN